MLPKQVRSLVNLHNLNMKNFNANIIGINKLKHPSGLFSTGSICPEFLRKLKKNERKPLVTSINELKRLARREKKQRQMVKEKILQPPENGLLVKELIPIAHEVYTARTELFACVSQVVKIISIYTCSLCGEVHVGHPPHKIRTCNVAGSPANKEHSWNFGNMKHILPLVESFHLYDRIGRAVSHNERLEVDRIPAIVELCIQAGIDISDYPTRRRVFPAYNIAGKIIDFEKRFPKEVAPGKGIDTSGFWGKRRKSSEENKLLDIQSADKLGSSLQCHVQCLRLLLVPLYINHLLLLCFDNIFSSSISLMSPGLNNEIASCFFFYIHPDVAVRGMEAWERIRSGASKLMQKYAVQTCGYCSEVQVGPKGHRVRNCQAYKHQMRDGQHAWQEATVDDLVPPLYVWHVQDVKSGKPLVNELKRYYGMLPAVVELFAQAGANITDNYAGIMREDVAVPELDEEKWVV